VARVARPDVVERQPDEKVGRVEIRIPRGLAANLGADSQVAANQGRDFAVRRRLDPAVGKRQLRKRPVLRIGESTLQIESHSRRAMAAVGQ